jgi:hypothetical protein
VAIGALVAAAATIVLAVGLTPSGGHAFRRPG